MSALQGPANECAAVIRRFSTLAPLQPEAIDILTAACGRRRCYPTGHELFTEGKTVGAPLMILSGWAALTRILVDGRRQILGLLLPGDLIGHCYQSHPVASSTVVTLTELEACRAPSSKDCESLHNAFAISHALNEAYLLAQITRLGRMNASERLADLFLEMFERLSLPGLALSSGFSHPLTQELVGDLTGLTTVHVSRTLKIMRKDNEVNWGVGHLSLVDPTALAGRIGRSPVRVTSTRVRRETKPVQDN